MKGAVQLAATFGVRLVSRRRCAREEETMWQLIHAMPDNMRICVVEVFCDSKAGAVYHLQTTKDLHDERIAQWAAGWLREQRGGYNGVSAGPEQFFGGHEIDPWWVGDDWEEESP